MRRIVPLKFDSWIPVSAFDGDAANGLIQPICGSIGLRIDPSRMASLRERCTSPDCPCCGATLAAVDSSFSDGFIGTVYVWRACADCGFWRYQRNDNVQDESYEVPSLKEFDSRLEVPSLSHLARQMSETPARLYDFDPHKFELFVGSVLQDFYRCEVHHVGRSGDDGVDLYAIIKDNPVMIQVKRRQAPAAVEGIDVVKLLFASAFARDATQGMVVTTARRFSAPAVTWSKSPKLADTGFAFQLVDFDSLMSMIGCVADRSDMPPWRAHQRRTRPAAAQIDSGWRWTTDDGFDCLFRAVGDTGQCVLFDHAAFEDCLLVSGSLEQAQHVFDTWERGHTISHPQLSVETCRTDERLTDRLGLSWDLVGALTEQWMMLYPDLFVKNPTRDLF